MRNNFLPILLSIQYYNSKSSNWKDIDIKIREGFVANTTSSFT